MTTFSYYQTIKKSALRILINAGVNPKLAYSMLKSGMPYIFCGKTECDAIDKDRHNL